MIDHDEKLLRAAAKASLARIRRDHAQAPKRIKPFLAYIRDHLFDPDLDVTTAKRKLGIRDNNTVVVFHSAVGRSPFRYIKDRRYETACELLAGTELKMWRIAQLVGISGPQVFNRSFRSWCGESPGAFRQRLRREHPESAPFDLRRLARSAGLRTPTLLRRALRGTLEAEHAGELIGRLHALYPEAVPGSNGSSSGGGAS